MNVTCNSDYCINYDAMNVTCNSDYCINYDAMNVTCGEGDVSIMYLTQSVGQGLTITL